MKKKNIQINSFQRTNIKQGLTIIKNYKYITQYCKEVSVRRLPPYSNIKTFISHIKRHDLKHNAGD